MWAEERYTSRLSRSIGQLPKEENQELKHNPDKHIERRRWAVVLEVDVLLPRLIALVFTKS